jgi:hypothetical protein
MHGRKQDRTRQALSSGLSALGMAGALLNTAAGQVGSGEAAPDYAKYTESYSIPFAKAVNFKHLTGMHVRASLNGGPAIPFLVDTGSVGIVVSADEVPNIDPKAPAGSIKYSSSGLEFDGVWTTATVTFPDSKDAHGKVATAVVPVLAVKERKVYSLGVNASNRKDALNPRVHMFGVGFGRGMEAHPEKSPFVNLIEMQAGTMRRGYTITRNGITLGLTAANVGTGYRFQKLTERAVSGETRALRPGLNDWQTTPGSVTVDALHAPMGTILMDTGLTNMMIAMPGNTATGDLALGTTVTIDLLGGKLHYSFRVGDTDDPMTPRKVTWVKPTHGVSVNTGLRVLAAFDYLYDADGGYLGLRPTGERRPPHP